MQDQPKGAGDESVPSTTDQDARDQRIVLTHVLALHPTHLTILQLAQEVAGGCDDFAAGDGVERAVRDLTGLGLLHCPGGVVMPTHAAVRFNALLGG